ncbi:prephenate dehydratase [Wenyingzhuangia sp. 2_MG-2023]|uniref:prephenate dehydratase n=1 Tax=Wenyingzhuangia sp. 2_MG-2023 TaxID=3062639 RepID=UPI0026E1FEFE|nr:prephenate dehydratase [Wenyingzhuangia sp. 2_MG-2023]MDO6737898.1 prephenate dehydratase [Wenyingzhuangia sp. 2_MG-2023]MDO6802748.1 prephenate dehydratase [Wenyingzhuangia sp. 1_MG-2023]
MKIAIQGIKGSYHHIVAENYFGAEIELVECMTFVEMPDIVLRNEVDYAVMAIENSIAGAILPNYALIDESDLTIVGEYYLGINHNLMALPGQKIEDIKKVHSHPMALLQCRSFFKDYPHIKLIEDVDTADVAKRIQENKLSKIGAIASSKAAEIYELNIVAEEIQTIKKNYTRFVIVQKKEVLREVTATKASLKFVLKHESGSLGEVLMLLANHKVNLSKIQSLPIIDCPWEYAFFADLVFEDYQEYKNAISDIRSKVSSLKILGEYKDNK